MHVCPVPLLNMLQRSSSIVHEFHGKSLLLELCEASASIEVREPGLLCGHGPRAGSTAVPWLTSQTPRLEAAGSGVLLCPPHLCIQVARP